LIFKKVVLKHIDELSININNSILVDMYLKDRNSLVSYNL